MRSDKTRSTGEVRTWRRGLRALGLAASLLPGCAPLDEDPSGAASTSDELRAANLALGRPVTASSVETAGLEAARAVDGNGTTRWSSAWSDSQWIRVDLGASHAIGRVKLTWEIAYGSAYRIQVSNDDVAWTTIYSTRTGNGGVDDLTGLSGAGRYVRMSGTARGTQWGYSLYEFAVYGVQGGDGGAGDTTPPTAPAGLSTSSVSATAAALDWVASSDNVGVAGYRVYKNGTQIAQTSSLSYSFTGLSCGTSTTLGVAAYDAAGNASALSTLAVTTSPCAPPSSPQPVGVGGTWTLAFDDEFDGNSLDSSRWSAREGGHMNNVTTHASNVAVAGGHLVLTLASSSSGAEVCSGSECGAGSNAFELPVGGYAEARVSFPGSGTTIDNWPAWWASGPSWPAAGENDIAEGLGTLTVNYHSPSGSHNHGTIPGTWSNGFHVYGLHRKAGSCDVYWDGTLVKSYLTDDNGVGQSLILNVGDGNTHVYGAASQVLVDYVRAWR